MAALSYVSYTGITQRANNTAIVNAASGSSRLISSYIASQGTYPLIVSTAVVRCITNGSGCHDSSGGALQGSATLDAEIAKIGTAPQNTPNTGTSGNGVVYQYDSSAVVGGVSQTVSLIFWLNGHNQDCRLPGLMDKSNQTSSAGNKTRCGVVVPGPAHV